MIDVLAANGVRRGERVLVILPDVPPFAWTFFGALGRGAVIAMGNPQAAPETLEYLVGYTRATAIVTVPSVATLLKPLVESATSEVQVVLVAPDAATGSDPEARITDFTFGGRIKELAPLLAAAKPAELTPVHRDEPAIWLFTSGSTGEPKANVHTNRDFAFNTEVYAKKTVDYRKDDITISVPRLFFGYATGTNLMFPFACRRDGGALQRAPDAGERLERDCDVSRHGRDERPDDARQIARARRRIEEERKTRARLVEHSLFALGRRGVAGAALAPLAGALVE